MLARRHDKAVQDAITPLRGLVTGVQTNPDEGLQLNLGSVTTKPQVDRRTSGAAGRRCHQVYLLLPSEMVQSALNTFTTGNVRSISIPTV